MKKFAFSFLLWLSRSLAYAADPCLDIQEISKLDSIYTFSVSGTGDPAYPNNIANSCNSSSALGGGEKIYRFVVPATGTYQINSVSNAGSKGVGFYYKRNASCSNTGWTCIDRNTGDMRSLGAFTWKKDDIILFLLNAELTSTTTQTFRIDTLSNICDDTTSITVGAVDSFDVFGYGDPNYPINMNGQGCTTNADQGGRERIYSLKVPATGTYQINSVSNAGSKGVGFYYKRNASCSNTGWTCIDRNTGDSDLVGTFTGTQGEIILILLNAELTSETIQTFQIINANQAPLPLKLLSFEVVHADGTNKLHWTTASEVNTDYFGVEHSMDGRTFTEVAKIKVVTRSNETIAYEAKHQAPANGINYYRLKMVDQDGKFSYSRIIAINLKQKSNLAIFPNPAGEELHIQVYRGQAETALLQIIDVKGRVVHQIAKQLYAGLNALSLNTTALPGGNYILVVKGKEFEQKMFVKQ